MADPITEQGHIEESRDEYARYHGLDIEDVEQHIVANRDFETEEEVRDAFRKVGATRDQWRRADGPLAEEGFVVEEEVEFETDEGETVTYTNQKANPCLEASHRLFWKRHRLEEALGLIEDGRYLIVWLNREPENEFALSDEQRTIIRDGFEDTADTECSNES